MGLIKRCLRIYEDDRIDWEELYRNECFFPKIKKKDSLRKKSKTSENLFSKNLGVSINFRNYKIKIKIDNKNKF